jgi:hypothetical protein
MMGQQEDGRLEALQRQVRDQQPNVWQEACRALASLAATSFAAYEEIRRLLQCPYGELRIRGLHALAHLAQERPAEVRQFIAECLGEPEIESDPVFADAVFGLLARLPLEMACRIVEDAVDDPRETVRAAAASSLAAWRGWRGPLLVVYAHDPSPMVRTSLALALRRLRDVAEAGEALEALAASPEPYVRSFLAEVMEEQAPEPATPQRARGLGAGLLPEAGRGQSAARKVRGEQPLLGLDLQSVGARLGRLLDEPDCRVRLVVSVEELFAEHPENIIEILYPLLERPGMASLLDQVAWLARDPSAASLCRALHAFLCPSMESTAHLLKGLQSALEGQRGGQSAVFGVWVRECASAAASRTLDEISRWARQVDGRRYAPLIDLVAAIEEADGMVGLEAVLSGADSVYAAIDDVYEIPVRRLVRMVAETWFERLDDELQELIAGVHS